MVLIVASILLASITVEHSHIFSELDFSRNTPYDLILKPHDVWKYTYVWINAKTMTIDYIAKLLYGLNITEDEIRENVLIPIKENITGEYIGKYIIIDTNWGEPRSLAIGFKVYQIQPVNASIIIEFVTPENRTYTFKLSGSDAPIHISIPLSTSGVYRIRIMNNSTVETMINITFTTSVLDVERPYLLYSISLAIIAVILLTYTLIAYIRAKNIHIRNQGLSDKAISH